MMDTEMRTSPEQRLALARCTLWLSVARQHGAETGEGSSSLADDGMLSRMVAEALERAFRDPS